MHPFLYFAYGSNMSIRRLQARTPSARVVGIGTLSGHRLAFHKAGSDGSAKCDIMESPADRVIGVLYQIDRDEKLILDRCEGLNRGYAEKIVTLAAESGDVISASTYYATQLDPGLKPYQWYKRHVLEGAMEAGLPRAYIRQIQAVAAIADPDPRREDTELAIYGDACKSPRTSG